MSEDRQLGKRVVQLRDLLLGELARSDLRAPKRDEREPSYTAGVLKPLVGQWLAALGLTGIQLAGDGAGPSVSVSLFGRRFVPDLAILSYDRKLIAIETKYIKRGSVSSDLSKAIGQANLYKALGFSHCIILLLDVKRALDTDDSAAARVMLARLGVDLVIRQRLRGSFASDHQFLSIQEGRTKSS